MRTPTAAFLSPAIPLGLAIFCIPASGQDAAGSRDHPLLTRMPNYRIEGYSASDFDAQDFPLEAGPVHIEGKKTVINYEIRSPAQPASMLQIVRNYQNALKPAGGQVVWEDRCCATTVKVAKGGQETWVLVQAFNGGDGYRLSIVEKGAMKQEVTAGDMLAALKQEGRIALYGIYFDTGKADLKQESEPALKQIAALLTRDPALKLHVVGHTDNAGDVAMNMDLSRHRAAAVVQALTTRYGVSAVRLRPDGVGPLTPVATNDDEPGRAKNRRVELVKQ